MITVPARARISNHDDQISARADTPGDHALATICHIGIASASLYGYPYGSTRDVGAPLTPGLVFPARMTQSGPGERDPPAGPIGGAPYDGAESPVIVVNSAMSIDSHGA